MWRSGLDVVCMTLHHRFGGDRRSGFDFASRRFVVIQRVGAFGFDFALMCVALQFGGDRRSRSDFARLAFRCHSVGVGRESFLHVDERLSFAADSVGLVLMGRGLRLDFASNGVFVCDFGVNASLAL